MKREVRVFIEGQQIDLFNDETIEVNSSVQNIADISKTSTDFSQAFTIPATTRNNAIFQHFYQSDVDGTYNFQERKDGYIEIDMTTFRRGRIQLEKSNVKNGQVENYTITFYGELTSLKDFFGEDKLSDLDFNFIAHDWTKDEIKKRIDGTIVDPDVGWPLITSNRVWQYNGAVAQYNPPNGYTNPTNNDIDVAAEGIIFKELFPAIKLSRIINAIENQYGITFTSNFFATDNFDKAYLWFKNRDIAIFSSSPQVIETANIVGLVMNLFDLTPYVDLINYTITFQYIPYTNLTPQSHTLIFSINSITNLGAVWYIDIYQNGNFYQTLEGQGTVFNGTDQFSVGNVLGLNEVYTYQVRSESATDIDFLVKYEFQYILGGTPTIDSVTLLSNLNVITGGMNLANSAPDFKVSDFFSGLLREFNLTVTGTDTPNTFLVETLNYWYASGNVFDITTFTDSTSIDIERVKLYKKISFRYQPSESALNKFYLQTGLKEYGDTEQQYPYDGGELNIHVPFENLMFNKFPLTNIQIGYCLNPSLTPYIPKPCILYAGQTPTATNPIYLLDDFFLFPVALNNVLIFGQDTNVGGIDYSLNFAPETSTYLGIPIQQSLFATYYFDYLANLYDPKNRITNVKAVLPISILTSLKLNDRLIIRDKRYIINDFKTNLTTGETTFNLLNDFIPILPEPQEGGIITEDDIQMQTQGSINLIIE